MFRRSPRPPPAGNVRALTALLAGKLGGQKKCRASTPGTSPCAPGTPRFDDSTCAGPGDTFRGDWVDLINYFYLAAIQELYHVGKGSVRPQFRLVSCTIQFGYLPAGPNLSARITRCRFPSFVTEWRQRRGPISGK